MMRRFYALLLLLIALLMSSSAWADNLKAGDTFDVDGMIFTVTNISPNEVQVGTGEETKAAINKDAEGSLKIPASIVGTDGKTYTVTTIGRSAFYECSKIIDINIPNSVISIGSYAFAGCSNVNNINIPNSVASIGTGAFTNCSNLKEIIIPNSVTRIPMWAFFGCISLTNVTIPNSVKTILDAAFSGCLSLESFNISESVTSIGQNVFFNTKWMNDQSNGILYKDNVLLGYKGGKPKCAVTIEEGTRIIADCAFFECEALISVSIPNTVKHIGTSAFELCGLTTLTIPNSVTSIGNGAFGSTRDLMTVISFIIEPFPINVYVSDDATLYVPVGTKALYEATKGWKEFKNIVEMTPYDVLDDNTVAAHFLQPDEEGKVEIPATVEIDGKTYTVTEIAANAFKDNKELTEVTIPGTVTTIGDGAFAGCGNLRAIYVFAPEPISLTAAEVRSMVTRAAENVPSQFEDIDFDACTLYVPIGSEQKYREAEGWKLFTHIIGVADPSGIAIVSISQDGNSSIYNLSGQRLAAPRRGLNIIGGKKVVVR